MKLENINELTAAQIAELKAQYGPLFKTTICNTPYLCRLLYKADWDIINAVRSENQRITLAEIDEKIVNMALIGPLPNIEEGGWASKAAGVIPSLSMLIRAKSGFIVPELEESAVIVDDLDGDAPVVKPEAAVLATLKENSPLGIKGLVIANDYFVVRPITRVEFKMIMQAENQSDQDLGIAQKAVMWPKGVNWDTKGAGFCDTISQFVIAISGYSGPSMVEDL